jgi:hypothetical protein
MVLLLVANNNSNNKQNQTIRFTIINTYFALHVVDTVIKRKIQLMTVT